MIEYRAAYVRGTVGEPITGLFVDLVMYVRSDVLSVDVDVYIGSESICSGREIIRPPYAVYRRVITGPSGPLSDHCGLDVVRLRLDGVIVLLGWSVEMMWYLR